MASSCEKSKQKPSHWHYLCVFCKSILKIQSVVPCEIQEIWLALTPSRSNMPQSNAKLLHFYSFTRERNPGWSVTTNNSGGCTQAPMKRTRRGCRNFRKASTSFFMASRKPSQIGRMFRWTMWVEVKAIFLDERNNQDNVFRMKSLLKTSSKIRSYFWCEKTCPFVEDVLFRFSFQFFKANFCKFASRCATPLMRFTATYHQIHLGNGVAVDDMTSKYIG